MRETPPMSGRDLRWWWATATAGVALLAVYVSLVPFEFHRLPPGRSFPDALAAALDVTWAARGNLVANAVMFLPFGFFGAASLVPLGPLVDERPRLLRWAGAVLLLLPVSILISVSIEAAQVFVPGRTPSIADVAFQTGGTTIGVVGWALVGRDVRAWLTHFLAGTRTALEVGLAVYAAVAFIILIEPFDVTVAPSALSAKLRSGGIVLNPLASSALQWDNVPSVLADLVLAIPVGILALVAGRPAGTGRRAGVAIGAAVVFYAVGELAQVFIRSRTADVVDLAANVSGAMVGVLLARTLVVSGVGGEPRTARSGGPRAFGVALAAAVVLYAVYNLSPFDFSFSRDLASRRLGWLVGLPFSGYYQNPEFKALADLLTKTSVALPIGVLFHLWLRPDRTAYHRAIALAWVGLSAAYFTAVEVGQVFLPSRYPDGTDILIGAGAVALGMVLAHRFTRPMEAGRP